MILPLKFVKPMQNLKIYSNTCECERNKSIFFFDYKNKKVIKASCKAYICPVCGPKKVYKFRLALTKYLSNFSFIRLFTFTQHTPINLPIERQYELIGLVWSDFIKEVRRCKSLSKSQKSFEYVKVVELTKRKYIHYHVCINKFLPILLLRKIWNDCLYKYFGEIGGRGGINIKAIANTKHVANYLTKYLSKGSSELMKGFRRWSKSNNIAIFEKYSSDSKCFCLKITSSGLLNLNINSISLQKKEGKFHVLLAETLLKDKFLSEIYEIIQINIKSQFE